MSASPTTQPDLPDLPAPDARLVLWRVSMSALLSTMPRRRGEKMLRVMAELMASEETVSAIFPIRPATEHAAVQKARREALGQFRSTLPTFLAMLDRE